jgi:hypothetical protein
LYGEDFLAFVGDKIVRHWPYKNFTFTSSQLYNSSEEEIKVTLEHWTPISFFRDLLTLPDMTEQDFYDALLYFYRVVIITKDEDFRLNQKYKTTRPFDAYDGVNIQIQESGLWKEIYNETDKMFL